MEDDGNSVIIHNVYYWMRILSPQRVGSLQPQALALLHIVLLLSLSSLFTNSNAANFSKSEIHVLWTYPGPPSDLGYSYALDRARLGLEPIMEQQGVEVHTRVVFLTNLPRCSASVMDVLMDGQPIDLWVVGGSQFGDCVDRVISDGRWPDLRYVVLGGVTPTAIVSSSTVSSVELRFLHGALCALASKSGVIGFVTTDPSIPPVSRAVTAFALGAIRFRPNIRIVVGITNDFIGSVATQKATMMLLDENADCLGSQSNELIVSQLASQNDVFSLGFTTDARYYVDETVLSSLLFDWIPAVLPFYEQIANNTWQPFGTLDLGFSDGAIRLSDYSTRMDPSWRIQMDSLEVELQNSSYPIFCAPWFNDTKWMNPNNTENVGDGITCLTQEVLARMHGITGLVRVIVEFNDSNSPYRLLWVTHTLPGSIVMYILVTILNLCLLAAGMHVIRHRQTPVYRASSVTFLLLILIGIILGNSSVYFRIGKRTRFSCMASWWFFGIGYAIIFSCVLAKNWRVWRIFNTRRLRSVSILNMDLLTRWVSVIVGLELVMLIVWTVTDPLVPYFSRSSILNYDEIQISCEPRKSTAMFIVFCTFNLLILVPVAVIAYLSRATKGDYGEARPLGAIVYTTVLVEVVLYFVDFALPPHYLNEFYLYSVGSWLGSLVVFFVLFTPKFWRFQQAADTPSSDEGVGLSSLKSVYGFATATSRTAGGGTRRMTYSGHVAFRGAEEDSDSIDQQ